MATQQFLDDNTECPKCGAPWKLVKRTPKIASLPELLTFECTACGYTETTTDEYDE